MNGTRVVTLKHCAQLVADAAVAVLDKTASALQSTSDALSAKISAAQTTANTANTAATNLGKLIRASGNGVEVGAKSGTSRTSAYAAWADTAVSLSTKAGAAIASLGTSAATLNASAITLGTASSKYTAKGYAQPETKTVVSSSVIAYKFGGLVIITFNNWSYASEIKTTNVRVGTLTAGWKPPAMTKGNLFAGASDFAAMVNVSTAGVIQVYSSYLPANQQLSGYVVYFAAS
jgi:hypothetical protein